MVIFFGVSLATTVENVRDVFTVPQKLNQILANDSVMFDFMEYSDHGHEMMWEMFRMMTDDDDTLQWYYVTEKGIAFDLDIRSTAEDVELAFVFKSHAIFPIFMSPADNRKYIIRQNGDKESYMTYLYKR